MKKLLIVFCSCLITTNAFAASSGGNVCAKKGYISDKDGTTVCCKCYGNGSGCKWTDDKVKEDGTIIGLSDFPKIAKCSRKGTNTWEVNDNGLCSGLDISQYNSEVHEKEFNTANKCWSFKCKEGYGFAIDPATGVNDTTKCVLCGNNPIFDCKSGGETITGCVVAETESNTNLLDSATGNCKVPCNMSTHTRFNGKCVARCDKNAGPSIDTSDPTEWKIKLK